MLKLILSIFIFSSIIISSEKKDIFEVLEKYNKAFGEKKYSEIIKFFDYPASFNLADKTITASNRFKLKLIYKKIIGSLPDYYSYSKWDDIDIQLIDDNIAIINADFSRYKKDHSIFYSGSAQYLLRLENNRWRIFSLTPYNKINTLK